MSKKKDCGLQLNLGLEDEGRRNVKMVIAQVLSEKGLKVNPSEIGEVVRERIIDNKSNAPERYLAMGKLIGVGKSLKEALGLDD